MRLSPYGVFNGTGEFPEVQAQYLALAHSLSALGVLYLHLVDHASMRAAPVPADYVVVLSMGASDATGLCAPARWARWQTRLAEVIEFRFAPTLLVHSAVPPMPAWRCHNRVAGSWAAGRVR